MTAADVIAEAKELAREHAAELDPFTAAEWLAHVVAACRRLWGLHPEAFHAGTARVGSMPAVPTATSSTISLADGWDSMLAAMAASRAVGLLRPADEGAMAIARETVARLEAAIAAGPGAI